MPISQEHNLNTPPPARRPYGIRITVRRGDPFANLVGDSWQKTHWFATAVERDRALVDMASRHPTFRIGDEPTLDFEKIEPGAG
jgi:hypothetical protein